MRKFTNPLNEIKIASPCGADWNEMRGDERRRHCAECRLNVYNLSDMSRREAENFLINSEGRVCLRVFRRTDGTVITKDCPVGWQKLKRKVSRTATSVFSLIAGFFGGVFALQSLQALRDFKDYEEIPALREFTNDEEVPAPFVQSEDDAVNFSVADGMVSNLPEIKNEILKRRKI